MDEEEEEGIEILKIKYIYTEIYFFILILRIKNNASKPAANDDNDE